MNTIDKKIEILSKSVASSNTICRILIGFSFTISLIILGVLILEFNDFEIVNIELITTALIAGCIGLLVGLALPNLFRKLRIEN